MNNKTLPSEMIRVPTVLIPVVRQLAKIHRDGHTTALLQGLQELIAQFDSSVKLEATSELQQVEEKLGELETHLCQQDQQVATKLEVLGKQLEKIEKAIASLAPEFDVRKPAKNEYSKGLEAFLERAYILNKP
ncbi:hypothetical protein [Dolichospermum flos-aquae]|uniref:hypothetical protein n=1 Tax=Dolichospermum flosaquae TaxID=1166 RepID=UPI001F3ED7E5|nr:MULTISPECIES: hypothetical protein [Nostocales]